MSPIEERGDVYEGTVRTQKSTTLTLIALSYRGAIEPIWGLERR